MTIDLSSLSPKELDSLIATAKKRQALLNKRAPINQVRSKLTRLAKAEGYTIEELFGGGGARKAAPARAGRKLGKVPPKYRNPENPKETWTGRGKQPRWLAAYIAKGRDLGEFLIPGTARLTPKPASGARKRVVKKK
ncbi:H-NS histone family protein [Pseudoxanthomonas sp. J35]|uniref:H-NS histone family protein n=1 Tax=Pseudoxanthomonas sp. J35 TaxID=935852 RepID=UPI0004902615|nr:H-NS histone family protein [Pseudoxanthomonas sp. J35]